MKSYFLASPLSYCIDHCVDGMWRTLDKTKDEDCDKKMLHPCLVLRAVSHLKYARRREAPNYARGSYEFGEFPAGAGNKI